MTNNIKDTRVENLLSEVIDSRNTFEKANKDILLYLEEYIKNYTGYDDTVVSGIYIDFKSGKYSFSIDLEACTFRLKGGFVKMGGDMIKEIEFKAPLADKYLKHALNLVMNEGSFDEDKN